MQYEPLTKNGVFESRPVKNIEDFIHDIKQVTAEWKYEDSAGTPWFRGQNKGNDPLLPCVLRKQTNTTKGHYEEFQLTRYFRNMAPYLGDTPPRNNQDQWLFFMQHFGLPTRLLDWTEGALIALFFALHGASKRSTPAVWMIHPLELNKLTNYINIPIKDEIQYWPVNLSKDDFSSLSKSLVLKRLKQAGINTKAEHLPELNQNLFQLTGFPNTWSPYKIAAQNIALAFDYKSLHKNYKASYYPIAIVPNYMHARLSLQKSCFTIHGFIEKDFETIFKKTSLVKNNHFKKYNIHPFEAGNMLEELRKLGITYSVLFPDFSGLSIELKNRYFSTVNSVNI